MLRAASTMSRNFHGKSTRPMVFWDMVHSNNAARIRLWLDLKATSEVERRVIAYEDLQKPWFLAINPLKKCPALTCPDGTTIFESSVILNYLEDSLGGALENLSSLQPSDAVGRSHMNLFIRIHDLYIASPNCTAPGFSHSQGAMYLSNGWHGVARGMDLHARSAKLAEIWKQLSWIEAQPTLGQGPHLCGEQLTLADLTWFPTAVFMEFMLPRVFGWPQLFSSDASTPFPKLAGWYERLRGQPAFAAVHADIWAYWEQMEADGQFAPIQQEIASAAAVGLKFTFGMSQQVGLNYQEPPPAGKRTGRYINRPDLGDTVDTHVTQPVTMHDGREMVPAATLETRGFELRSCPTALTERLFRDDEAVVATYYAEMMRLIKEASGASRVYIFDHTVRESDNTNLNAEAGSSAAPVPRVHCDYTAEGAPRRLKQLGRDGIYSRLRKRLLHVDEVDQLAAGRFAFINVWRSISEGGPVQQMPLAVCDEESMKADDRFLYELIFPDRVGENYSARHSPAHKWYYYPQMAKDECLIFKVYDKKKDGPRFVFHTAFDDPSSPANPPGRKSIEIRAVAFYDVPPNADPGIMAGAAQPAARDE